MEHKSPDILRKELSEAKEKVKPGTLWGHFKNPDHYYKIVDLVIIEETDSVGVLYQSTFEPTKGITFLRPIEGFLDYKETENGKVKRFTQKEE